MIYIFLVIWTLLGLLICRKKSKFCENLFLSTSFIFLFLVSGFRYGIGTDYFSYQNIFNFLEADNNFFEPGLILLSVFLKSIGAGSQSLFLSMAFITLFLFSKGISQLSENKMLSVVLLLLTGHYFASLNWMQQYVAIAIVFVSFIYIINANFIKYMIATVLAICFHFSAGFMMPFYFILRKKYNKKMLIILWLFSLIFVALDARPLIMALSFFMPENYLSYLQKAEFLETNNLAKLKLVLPNFLAVLILWKNKLLETKYSDLVIKNAYFFSVLGMNCVNGIKIITRLMYYLDISIILAIPILGKIFVSRQRPWLTCFMILIYAIQLFIILVIQNGHEIIPYDFKIDF